MENQTENQTETQTEDISKPERRIYISAIDRWVSLGNYVRSIKKVKANPLDRVYEHGLTCWWRCTGKDIMEQFRKGMMERINEAIPYIKRGVE